MRNGTFNFIVILILALCSSLNAEQGFLVLHAANPQDRPMPGVVLSTAGDGSTGSPTDRSGKTRIRLAPQTQPNTWVTLQVTSPPELVFISPWDGRARVPPFENQSENFVPVVLGKRGDRAMIESGSALASMAARINAASAPVKTESRSLEERRSAALAEASRLFGIDAAEADRAIRALPARSKDPYDKGMAALYARNYGDAAPQLAEALLTRGKQLKKVPSDVVNAALFLGQALFEQGKYDKAAEAYRKAQALRPDDPAILNGLGLALLRGGKPDLAEPFLQRSLELQGESVK